MQLINLLPACPAAVLAVCLKAVPVGIGIRSRCSSPARERTCRSAVGSPEWYKLSMPITDDWTMWCVLCHSLEHPMTTVVLTPPVLPRNGQNVALLLYCCRGSLSREYLRSKDIEDIFTSHNRDSGVTWNSGAPGQKCKDSLPRAPALFHSLLTSPPLRNFVPGTGTRGPLHSGAPLTLPTLPTPLLRHLTEIDRGML